MENSIHDQLTKEEVSRYIHCIENEGYEWLGPILRRALFAETSKIDWQAVAQEIEKRMPEGTRVGWTHNR